MATTTPFNESLSNPIIICIANLTDEKIYDVKVFNFDYKENKKLSYSGGLPTVSYSEILASKSFMHDKIDRILYIAVCDYHKFLSKQLNSSGRWEINKSNGEILSGGIFFGFDPYQMQTDRVIWDAQDVELSFFESQIILPFLMPETSVQIRLYPLKIKSSTESINL